MHVLRRVVAIVYTLLLALGAALCVWGLFVSINEYSVEPLGQTVPRGGASILTLVVTAAFAIVMFRCGFRPLALPLFGFSFCAVAASLVFSLGGYMKNWAPATASEAAHSNRVAIALVVGALAFAMFAIWLSGRHARRVGG